MTALGDKPYLGRCKSCDYALFATNEQIELVEDFSAVTAGAGAKRVGNNGVFARCTNGHKFFMLRAVKGTYSPDHKCDARCLNAKGHDCTCSCGGANHGRGHILTVHEVPRPEMTAEAKRASDTRITEHYDPDADADRHKGHVTRTEDGPTGPQVDFIGRLAAELGEMPPVVSTRSEASDKINALKARIAALRATAAPAMSEDQHTFINRLMDERVLSVDERREATAMIDAGLSKSQAHRWIDRLLSLPKLED
jgi:hypothetical protein